MKTRKEALLAKRECGGPVVVVVVVVVVVAGPKIVISY